MKIPTKNWALAALVGLAACSNLRFTGIEDMSATEELRPPNAEAGACYSRTISPATIETITRHFLARAAIFAQDGSLLTPAAYRTETRQRIVTERQDNWFKVPCSSDKVDAFDASVQRALQARGLYRGKITGIIDTRTRRAIRKYQAPMGVDSGALSLAAARTLGLVPIPRPKGLSEAAPGTDVKNGPLRQ